MQVATIGLDIAKNVFQVHGIDAHPEARQGRPDAFLTASSHAAACVRL
jgi:hypothetical protein